MSTMPREYTDRDIAAVTEADVANAVLHSFASLHSAIAAATVYKPRVGRRSREFLSARDALAYEDGYNLWPHPLPDDTYPGMPSFTGWMDAEHEAQDREQERQERAAERWDECQFGELRA